MGFIKCPRCELNYMQEGEQYCTVCMREMKGEIKDDPFDLCSVCGENPIYPGKDLCLFCLKEMGKSNETAVQEEEAGPADEAALELGNASHMDEITLDVEADIPPRELGEISRELSLQEALEEETLEEEAEEDEDA
ncbi:MAG: hypothetical protein LBU67_07915 [Oscillospiraceae bacterium]|jgi:hypothetical protein|nr:hypothetical protein [Oscillospiraceae bacterium]